MSVGSGKNLKKETGLKVINHVLKFLLVISPLFLVQEALAFGGPFVERRCVEPAQEMIEQCRVRFRNEGAAFVGLDAINRQNAAGDSGRAEVQGVEDSQNLAGDVHSANSELCAELASTCESNCREAFNHHDERARNGGPQAAEHQQHRSRANDANRELCGALASGAMESLNSAMASYGQAAGTGQVGDRMEGGNGGGGGMGGLGNALMGAGLAAGAACLFEIGGMCADDEEEEGEEDDTGTADSDGPVDCKAEGSHDEEECKEGYLVTCMENPEASNCREFSNMYCGMNLDLGGSEETTDESSTDSGTNADGDGEEMAETTEEPSSPEGLGSSFCEFQVAVEFCRSSSNEDCPSCEQLELQNNPVCQDNPVACMPSISDSQMAAYQAQCPADPMYASASYIQNNSVGGASNDGSSTSFGTAQPVQSLAEITADASGNIDYSEVLADRGGISTTFSRVPAGVGAAMDASLFSATSQVFEEKCELGELNNCGPFADN